MTAIGTTSFVDVAAGIGGTLARDAMWAGDRCAWVGGSLEPGDGAWRPVYRVTGPDVYDGSAGIGLFLAVAAGATGERVFRVAAAGALRHALARLDDIAPVQRLGLYTGWLGVAWAMAHTARALGEERWAAEARRIIERFRFAPERDMPLDVLAGAAGGVQALLALAGLLGAPGLRDRAAEMGDFLLRTADKSDRGWSWPMPGMPVPRLGNLTGYSHGSAGVGLALLELHAATGTRAFRAGADEAFRYERSWFDARAGNWPDLRDPEPGISTPDEPACGVAWCHGAPGIGLARLRAWELTRDGALRDEAVVAARTTVGALRESRGRGCFCLCHGHAGNAELLVHGAATLGEPAHRAAAEEVGAWGKELYHDAFAGWPAGTQAPAPAPGLFTGLAGIGLFYLRLADAKVPSAVLVTPGV